MKTFRIKVDTILLLVPLIVFSTFAHAETFTLNEALGIAYETNPQLNAQRAALRASDEEVAKALAGWRPTIAQTGAMAPNKANITRSLVRRVGPTPGVRH